MANQQIVIFNPQTTNLQTSTDAQRDFAAFICGPPAFAPNFKIVYSAGTYIQYNYFGTVRRRNDVLNRC